MTPDAARYADDSLTWGVPSRRVGAFVIDWLLIAVLTMGVSIGFAVIHVMSLGLLHGPAHLFLIVGFIYETLWIAGPGGATPGQRSVGLAVRRMADLERPTLVEAAAFVALLYITLAAGVIWLAVAFFTYRRRAIHDMISGLVVVRAGALRWTGPWQS
jgi:uncharacterized RDD family membrane protein YckC